MLQIINNLVKKSKAVEQGLWLMFGIGSSQGIRLAGNLILTRLLAPEAFGVMALASAVILAFGMLSDVGIRNSVIKSDRTHEASFMETVWTLQLFRGIILAALIWCMAWPVANFYDEPILIPVLIVFSLSLIIHGAKSVALYLYDKQLNLKTQILVDTGAQLTGTICMIVWAYFFPSIWALVAGAILSASISLVTSYTLFQGHYSKINFDRVSINEILSFGKWIFISSMVGYIALHGDKLIMGNWMTMGQLGVYSIAIVFGSLISMIAAKFSGRLLDALFKQHIDKKDFSSIKMVRYRLNAAYLSACLILAWFGDLIIELLYDDRYIEAGWMLQLLSLRSAAFCFNTTLTPFLLASGDSFSQMKYQIVSTTGIVIGMIFGAQFGILGLLLAYCVVPIFSHLYMAYLARQHGFHCLRADFLFLSAYVILSLLGWTALDSAILTELVLFISPT
ncbi:MAG: oligosaccharide flippase family protein [Cellvibrionaceae bacterium]